MRNDAYVGAFRLQDRSLFDVEFEEGMHPAGTGLLITPPADALQFVAKTKSVRVGSPVCPLLVVDTGKDT